MSKIKKIIGIIIAILLIISIVGIICARYAEKKYTIASVAQYEKAITEANSEAGAKVRLTATATSVHMGDTITITITAKCDTGIGGLDAVLDWDQSKVQFVNEANFQLSGTDETTGEFKFSVLYNGDENEAELAALQFKILDTATAGEPLSINFSEVELIDNNIESIEVNNMGVTLNVAHIFTNYTSNNDATCEEDGTKTATCEKCIATDTIDDVGTAKGHTFTNYVSNNDATCEEDGTKTAKCNKCTGTKTIDDVGSATGHTFTNYISNSDATCEKDGTKTATCDNCTNTNTIDDVGSKLPHNYQNGKCTGCGKDAPKLTISSEKYEVTASYILKISHKTSKKSFVEGMKIANATEIKLFDKNNKQLGESDFVGTGTTLILKSETETKTFKLIIAGDVTGDGEANFKDIVAINRHRLKQSILQDEFLSAGEITGDEEVDFKDIVKINRFRLNKITKLF